MAPTRRTFSREELAFLDAIHAAPRDDGPRRRYSEWLMVNGDPDRAHFIRLMLDGVRPGKSIRRSTRHSKPYCPEDHLRELEVRNRRRWLRRPPAHLYGPSAAFYDDYAAFVAGLPMLIVQANMTNWNELYRDVARWISPDCQIDLRLVMTIDAEIGRMLRTDFILRVTALSVYGPPDPTRPPEQADWRLAPRLPLSGEQASTLAETERLRELRSLTLVPVTPEAQTIVENRLSTHVPTRMRPTA